MSELRAQQEKQIYELTNENFQKVDQLQLKWEADKKAALLKLKDEIALKNERIKELEKNEKRAMTDKDTADSLVRQNKEIQERMRALASDRDIMQSEKAYLEERIKKQNEELADLKFRLGPSAK